MKKRFVSILLAMCMVLAMLPGIALATETANSGTCGDNLTWTLDTDGVLTISGTGDMYDYSHSPASNIPWFSVCTGITRIVIENGVTSIGGAAFSDCSNLFSVTVSEGITRIENSAFSRCSSLTSINIPAGVTSIGDAAFYECRNLRSITIPSSVTSIGDSAFIRCSGLTSVTIPFGVTSIGECAFQGCNGLTSITIPSSVTSMGRGIFSLCSGLTSINIISGVTIIGDYAFGSCSSLTNVTIPESVTHIGESAFYDCKALINITIPSGVISIGDRAFQGCNSLTSITVPFGVTSIGDAAFRECMSLTSITIPSSVTSIGSQTFFACRGLESITIPSGVTCIEEHTFAHCTGLTNITIPSGVTAIGNGAFSCCYGLTSITIPSSVTAIEDYAFEDCRWLTSVYYGGSEAKWKKIVIGSGNEALTSATIHYNGEDTDTSIIRFYPASGSTFDFVDTSSDTRMRIFFDREVSNGGGNRPELDFSAGTLEVHKASDDSIVYQVQYGTEVSLWNVDGSPTAVVLRNATAVLDYDTEYYVTMPEGFIKLADGAVSPAIEKGDWQFRTAVGFFATTSNVILKPGYGDNATASVPTSWDDKWFIEDTTKYNHKLALASMALSGAAYVEDENEIPQNESITNALEKFGFGDIESHNYDYGSTKNDNDHVAYTFATKEIEYEHGKSFHLVAVVIKGTSGDNEWYSNFNMGQYSTMHQGFGTAQGELIVDLWDYIAECELDGKPIRFLITGHSRGAGVANLLAGKLTDNSDYGIANVFGYTFASPLVSKVAKETGYENIFNIINSEDFVTRVPLESWGYSRYGIDLVLPSTTFYGDGYEKIYSSMNSKFVALTGQNFKPYDEDKNEGTIPVRNLVENVSTLSPTVDSFYTLYHTLYYGSTSLVIGNAPIQGTTSDYFNILADLLISAKPLETIPNTVEFIRTLTGKYAPITWFFLNNGKDIDLQVYTLEARAFTAHCMAGYYAWLSTCKTTEEAVQLFVTTSESNTLPFKSAKIECPVDVYVYNESNELVASVVDEKIVENELAVYVEDGAKTIDLPCDQEYFIKIVATDAGSVSYTISEFSATGVGDSVLRTVNFNSIDIDKGDLLTGSVNDVLYTDNINYALTKNDADTIYADYDSYNQVTTTPTAPVTPTPTYPTGGNTGTSTSTTYTITIPSVTGGTVTATPKSASKGSTVTLTATPNEGYELASLTITDSKGNELELTNKGNDKYTFTMPNSNVTVSATFAPVSSEPTAPTENTSSDEPYLFPFTDVLKTDWFCSAVEYVFNNDLMTGTAPYTFDPQGKMSRAMVWTVLGRMADADVDGSVSPWYAKAQAWATTNNVSDGTNPNNSISRQELMTMLWRYVGSPAATSDLSKFSDSEYVADWANGAMQWAVSTGLLVGDNGRLNPASEASRCEVATIFMRFCENIVK